MVEDGFRNVEFLAEFLVSCLSSVDRVEDFDGVDSSRGFELSVDLLAGFEAHVMCYECGGYKHLNVLKLHVK